MPVMLDAVQQAGKDRGFPKPPLLRLAGKAVWLGRSFGWEGS